MLLLLFFLYILLQWWMLKINMAKCDLASPKLRLHTALTPCFEPFCLFLALCDVIESGYT